MSTHSAQLDALTAEVMTASVDVRVLTLRGKQVTLSVFRQLMDADIVADDGTLTGRPWGTVNYHPDKKCATISRHHLHVVWQLGEELRRAAVEDPASVLRERFWSDAADDLILADTVWDGYQVTLPKWAVWDHRREMVHFRAGSTNLLCTAYGPPRSRPDVVPDRRVAYADMVEDIQTEEARRAQCLASWEVLTELPQLFIAI